MIWIWLVLLAAIYVVVAIVVGKMCAINSRWEKSVDGVEPGSSVNGLGSRGSLIAKREFDLLPAEGIDGQGGAASEKR
ncbi:MAG: hypothetical protein JW958_05115 [Candidatus Eisenbacteria bacterium]|nr:hypothetical protein [Candidatus Eisenbacteria bacterium]